MFELSSRLEAVASLVRKGSSLADIGCDHGYLPVYLVMNGIIENAVASDINDGPLKQC
uniref:tRNA (adenine(22)-N(1))-methyltransferase TrmK n=1 Tax=Eubacterium sp. TaxID=142586 RepID=UPI00402758DF